MAKAIPLEENFDNLEKILEVLENGKLTLDESFKLYQDGIKLVKNCNNQIDKVEKQIMILDKGGEEKQNEI